MGKLTISANWVSGADTDVRRAGSAAELLISVDGVAATKLLDSWSKTVVEVAHLPLYPMAEWFAYNWWRLHAEAPFDSGSRPPIHWRLAHDMGAIGAGYVWPRIRFASDGEFMVVSALAKHNASWEPVRHLNDIAPTPIDISDFDRSVSEFVELVLHRLSALKLDAEPLATIWADLSAERADAELSEWRTWEARLGYSPDEAPEEAVVRVAALAAEVGANAASELAPLFGSDGEASIDSLNQLASTQGVWADLPSNFLVPRPAQDQLWDYGRRLASAARRRLSLPDGAIDDESFANTLGIPTTVLRDTVPTSESAVGLGVRSHENRRTALHFRKRNRQGRRFEAARFLVDNIIADKSDMWLPLTDRGTARQKIQRAFAAELLAPIQHLTEFLRESRSPESIDDAAEYFGVSPWAVRSHLANNGLLPTEEVYA